MALRLDRIVRSLADRALLVDRVLVKDWAILLVGAAGLDLPTVTTGHMVASALGSAAAFERDLIRVQTRETLAVSRAASVKLGRPRLIDPALTQRIGAQRAHGMRLWGTADSLHAEASLTPSRTDRRAALVRKFTLGAAGVAA